MANPDSYFDNENLKTKKDKERGWASEHFLAHERNDISLYDGYADVDGARSQRGQAMGQYGTSSKPWQLQTVD